MIKINYLKSYQHPDWKNSTFILASVNVFAQTKTDIYPAELALAKFNIKNGLQESINFHIDMELPVGLLNEAKNLAEDTHQIPSMNRSDESRQGKFKLISFASARTILAHFLNDQKIVFSFTETLNKYKDIESSEAVLNKLFNLQDIVVGSTEQLLATLLIRDGQPLHESLNVREKLLKNHWEDFSIGCTHHIKVDANKYCTLARVKRWAFRICQLLLPPSEFKAVYDKTLAVKCQDDEQLRVNDFINFDFKDLLGEAVDKSVSEASVENASSAIVEQPNRPVAVINPFKMDNSPYAWNDDENNASEDSTDALSVTVNGEPATVNDEPATVNEEPAYVPPQATFVPFDFESIEFGETPPQVPVAEVAPICSLSPQPIFVPFQIDDIM